MPTVEQTARKDHRKKLKLEKRLIRKLRKLNNLIVKDFIMSYVKDGEIIQATKFFDEYENLLLNHYIEVGNQFNNEISPQLPKEVEETEDERSEILAILLLFYQNRAPQSAGFITRTTQKNINISIIRAITETLETVEFGQAATRRDIALNAGAILRRLLNGRNGGIATTETQSPSEEAKQVEAEVLSPTGEEDPQKEWVTMRDKKVRRPPASSFNHVKADRQKRPLTGLYDVSGQKLKMPGDRSHGASLGNIIRCRCSSVVDVDDIINIRMIRYDKEAARDVQFIIDIPRLVL